MEKCGDILVKEPITSPIMEAVEQFFVEENHPCLMAQGVVKSKNFTLHVLKDPMAQADLQSLMDALQKYIITVRAEADSFASFIVVLETQRDMSEAQFERWLWSLLQDLHSIDNSPWDATVNPDPSHDKFSFSLHGTAFYIVGMHANSSRKARQFPYPLIAFNLHEQFEALRQMGTYTSIRDRIRDRDKNINGSVNPMLKDFGITSEARQYSGRHVNSDWVCPFHHK